MKFEIEQLLGIFSINIKNKLCMVKFIYMLELNHLLNN